jgi:hypothetical protein
MTPQIRKLVTFEEEIRIVLGGATGGRPHHRIGDRYKDLEALGHAVDNPAAV